MRNRDSKHKEVSTTKMLDFVGKNYDYGDEKNIELKREYEDEIENREPFDDIKRKLDRQQEQIRELKTLVTQLQNHRHDEKSGNVTVFLQNQPYSKTIF